MSARAHVLLIAAFLLLGAGCAARLSVPDCDAPPLKAQWPEEEMLFRHRVALELPGAELPGSFDGILRYAGGGKGRSIRVLGLGGIGLTLFDLTLTEKGAGAAYLLPSLKAVPRAQEHIARCAGSMALAALALRGAQAGPFRALYGEEMLEGRLAADGSGVLRASGPGGEWSLEFSAGRPWPERMIFRHRGPEYTVTVRLVDGEQGGTSAP